MGSDGPDTLDLLRRSRSGDDDALGELLRRLLPWIRAHVRLRLSLVHRRKGETVDFVQEAFVKVLRHGPRFETEDDARLRALLVRLIENLLHDEYDWLTAARRDVGREEPAPADTVLALDARVADRDPTPSRAAALEEEAEWVRLAMGLLDPLDREVIYLKEWEGAGFREIGERLGIAEDTARMRFHRAIPKLAIQVAKLRSGRWQADDARG